MAIAYIIFNFEMFAKLMRVWQGTQHPAVVRDATQLLQSHMQELAALKQRFNSIKVVDHNVVDAFNAEFQHRIGFDYRKLKQKS